MGAIIPENKMARPQARKYQTLDTMCEDAFDGITRLAAQVCSTPIALINLVDERRQCFKSKVGLDAESTIRDLAFCAHAILQPNDILIVPDTQLDDRFANNPLVISDPHIRFYAGVPLTISEGYALGTLCVIDNVPRHLSPEQLEALDILSRQVIAQLELKRHLDKVEPKITTESPQINEIFCALSHDLRTPLIATRSILASMLGGALGSVTDVWKDSLVDCRQANEEVLKLVEDLLNIARYKNGANLTLNCEILNWEEIFVQAIRWSNSIFPQKCPITYKISPSLPTLYGDLLEIQRVVQNLLDNAVQVSEPNQQVTLEVTSIKVDELKVSVCDNAPGIAPQDREKLFHRFIQGRGRRGKSGLGLYLCRQIIEAHKGIIGVESTLGKGSTFWFTLPVAPGQTKTNCSRCCS